MAMGIYQNIDQRLDYTYTDAKGNFSTFTMTDPGKTSVSPQPKAGTDGVIDALRIGKTGYQPVLVPIKSYDEKIDTVTHMPINIEAKVNAVMARHMDDIPWMVGQVTEDR